MAIERIDFDLCDGCWVCVDSCPADVLRMAQVGEAWETKGWKAIIAYPQDCHGCKLCVQDCHVNAITVSQSVPVPKPFQPHKGFMFFQPTDVIQASVNQT
jgi:NAD-dependent dihydropyrimidine dehydrogenase PreA subunit